MKTIYQNGRFGQWLKDQRINIYGWVEFGVNASTSGVNNLPAAYEYRPNQPELDQLVLYFERKPDEAQGSHYDWGFLFANLYGLDYHFTISRGILSSQVLRRNRIYGYDPVMFYLDFYIPWIFEGMNIRIGRYISVPDIEAQLAPRNPMFTHSILYNFDLVTQTGIITTTQINKNWRIQLGISASNVSHCPERSNSNVVRDFQERDDAGTLPISSINVSACTANCSP